MSVYPLVSKNQLILAGFFYLLYNRIRGYRKVDTPVPIPNTEVKHFYADGSKLNLARVGRCF